MGEVQGTILSALASISFARNAEARCEERPVIAVALGLLALETILRTLSTIDMPFQGSTRRRRQLVPDAKLIVAAKDDPEWYQ